MKFLQLKSKLSSGVRSPVYLIEGTDSFFRQKAEEMLLAEFKNDCFDLNSSFFYEDYKISDAISACYQLPFMSETRIVIVKEYYPKATELDNGVLLSYAKEPVKSSLLLLVNQNKSEISKKLKDFIEVIDCNIEEPEIVARWIVSLFKQKNMECENPVAIKLCEYCRSDMSRISGEIEKLFSYCEGNKVTLQDVENLVAKDLEYQVYELSNELTSRNSGKAFGILSSLLEKNDVGFISMILVTLYNYFKRIYIIKDCAESDKVLSSYLGVKEFAVKMSRKQAAAISKENLKSIIALCQQIDTDFKSGKINAETAIHFLVLSITDLLGKAG